MKFRQSLLAITTVFAVFCAGPLAFADKDDTSEPKKRRWYVGGGIGASDDKEFDETEFGGKGFGGYRVSKYFALEGAFVGLGEFGEGTLGIGTGGTFRKGGLSAQAVGILPIGQRAQLFGKAGIFFWSVTVDETCTTVNSVLVCVDNGRLDDGVDPVYGGGFQYRFNDRWSGRVEWERYEDVGGGDVDLGTIGAIYSF